VAATGGGPVASTGRSGCVVNRGTASRLAGLSARRGQGPDIGRHPAQQLARRELSRAMYQESDVTRILDWLGRLLGRLFEAGASLPGGWWSTIALLAALALAAAVVTAWVRPSRSRRDAGRGLLSGAVLGARDHRELAERSAADGDFSAASVERMRAIAVEIEVRGILPAQPGRTADELAGQAGRVLPGLATELAAAARRFDDILYGGRPGTAAGYQQLCDLDAAVQAASAGSTPGRLAAAPAWAGPA
jgi:Domain of unknown function (DUF4129)